MVSNETVTTVLRRFRPQGITVGDIELRQSGDIRIPFILDGVVFHYVVPQRALNGDRNELVEALQAPMRALDAWRRAAFAEGYAAGMEAGEKAFKQKVADVFSMTAAR